MRQYSAELEATVREFPDFRVILKTDSAFMKVLSVVLFFNKGFMTYFVTTIGSRMWVPTDWTSWSDQARAAILRHERVHLRQQRRYGMLRYSLMYLLWPLPILLAKGRRDLEMEAYEESMAAYAEYWGKDYLEDSKVRERFIQYFTSSAYAWMWIRRSDIEAWYDRAKAKILNR